jgi:hypothetical protein
VPSRHTGRGGGGGTIVRTSSGTAAGSNGYRAGSTSAHDARAGALVTTSSSWQWKLPASSDFGPTPRRTTYYALIGEALHGDDADTDPDVLAGRVVDTLLHGVGA